jgi:multidrug efflux pump subunit AcrA (membrane-fusion protein)
VCDPVTIGIATAALAVGGAVMDHVGTNQAYHANELAANLNYAQQSNTLGRKAVELDQAKSEDAADTAIATARAQGEISASASDQGLGAPSVSSALHASMFGIGRQASIADLNDANARAQIAAERQGANLSRQSQIASKSRSSLLQLGLGVGGGILKGVSAGTAAGK